ncbi:hypothetical protein GGQ88_003512 [Novosphingobium hassiacum]|uniref:Uncharacterized protein n=1 Tax=Novosphingobium hassiacum TaxID=173676 RepID=A0A7W6A112_9SPHN|nr:hypothetical protein [Novosphingobium hassiacum]MBB3862214.1 hypothetical protein [Novosphingobium hassiacum]
MPYQIEEDLSRFDGTGSSRLAAFYARKGGKLSAGTASPRPAAATPARRVSAPAQASPPIVRAPQVTKADLDRAVATAVAQERARAATVFASDKSRGRERVCATLLSSPHGFSAQAIVKELGSLPLDRDVAAKCAQPSAEARAEIDARWAKAYASPRII